jgi:hypothetical protein
MPDVQSASHTIPEYCKLENVSRSKVYEDAKAGRIAIVKQGRKSVIFEEERQRRRAELLAEARRVADERRKAQAAAQEAA